MGLHAYNVFHQSSIYYFVVLPFLLQVRRNWENVTPLLAPVRKPDPVTTLPDKKVSLEWVYGINAHCSRQSVYYTAKGESVRACARHF